MLEESFGEDEDLVELMLLDLSMGGDDGSSFPP